MPLHLSVPHEKFSALFALPSALAEEAALAASPDGLSMMLVDSAKVRMAKFDAKPAAFQSYKCDDSAIYGLNLEKLKEFLKNTKKIGETEAVEMLLPDKAGKLTLKCGRVKVSMALLDTRNMPKPRDPKVEEMLVYSAVSVVRGPDFRKFVEAANTLGTAVGTEAVEFVVTGGILVASSKGDTDEAEVTIGPVQPYVKTFIDEVKDEAGKVVSSTTRMETQNPEGARTCMSTNLVMEVFKALPDEDITLKIGTDLPLLAHYADESIEISAFIAPRIEN